MALAAATVAGAALLVPTAAAEPSPTSPDFPSDEFGYSASAARCDGDQTLVALGRTSRALVAICVGPDGQLEYRGVRLGDQAFLTMAADRGADGTVTAANDGVTYTVTPERILVSDGDEVLYRDAWIEFRQPGFSGATTAPSEPSTAGAPISPVPSASAAPAPPPAAATGPAAPASSPTVSTTTVTLTPTAPAR
jgi:hypothetical protein